jgi:hypothetical protein
MLKVSAVKTISIGAVYASGNQLYVIHRWFGCREAFGGNSYVTDWFATFLAF